MKNIFQIFYHDIKKIRKNVIALIVILPLCVVQHCCKLGSIWKYRRLESCYSQPG